MLSFEIISILGILIYGYASLAGIAVYKFLDLPSRFIVLLMIITMVNDIIATFFAYKYHNNNIVYGFFSPIQLLLICLYFNYSIDSLRRYRIGIGIGVFFLLLGYVDYFLVHSPSDFNGNYMIVESLLVNAMCLYSFYRMLLMDDNLDLSKYIHFWFCALWMFFWTCTFFVWGTYRYLNKSSDVANYLLQYSLVFSNVITYLGFGTIFLFSRKMQTLNG